MVSFEFLRCCLKKQNYSTYLFENQTYMKDDEGYLFSIFENGNTIKSPNHLFMRKISIDNLNLKTEKPLMKLWEKGMTDLLKYIPKKEKKHYKGWKIKKSNGKIVTYTEKQRI